MKRYSKIQEKPELKPLPVQLLKALWADFVWQKLGLEPKFVKAYQASRQQRPHRRYAVRK